MSNQEHIYSEFNISSYKRLIDNWSSKKIKEDSFKYEGESIGESTLSTLFFDQMLKKTLTRICFFLESEVELNENDSEAYKINQILSPLIKNATEQGYSKSPMTETEVSVIQSLPITFFSSWLVLTLERDILPYKKKLEHALYLERA